MIIDNEAHRELLLTALEALPVNGPVCHPELLAKVQLAHEVRSALLAATLPVVALDPSVSGLSDR